jgi:hypothetical protein
MLATGSFNAPCAAERAHLLKAAAAFLAAALPGRLPIVSGLRCSNSVGCNALGNDVGLSRFEGRERSSKLPLRAPLVARLATVSCGAPRRHLATWNFLFPAASNFLNF